MKRDRNAKTRRPVNTQAPIEESKELLRETLDRYVRELAEELLYWVDQLNKLDTSGASRPKEPLAKAEPPWRQEPHGREEDPPARVRN